MARYSCSASGQLHEAEQLYRAILQVHPNQSDTHHNLGVLPGQTGQHAAGLPHLKAAFDAHPTNKQYVQSYADALLTCGRAADALKLIKRAVQRGAATPTLSALRQKAEAALCNPALSLAECRQLVDLF